MELPITLSWNSVLQILSYKLASPLTALSTALFLLCWFSVNQFSNPVHTILIKASYMSLWNLTAPLFLRPSKNTHTKPSVKLRILCEYPLTQHPEISIRLFPGTYIWCEILPFLKLYPQTSQCTSIFLPVFHLSPRDGYVIFDSRCLILTTVNSSSYVLVRPGFNCSWTKFKSWKNALFSQTAFKIRYNNLCIRFGIWKVRRQNQIRSKVAPKLKYPGALGENNGWDLPNWNRRS